MALKNMQGVRRTPKQLAAEMIEEAIGQMVGEGHLAEHLNETATQREQELVWAQVKKLRARVRRLLGLGR